MESYQIPCHLNYARRFWDEQAREREVPEDRSPKVATTTLCVESALSHWHGLAAPDVRNRTRSVEA